MDAVATANAHISLNRAIPVREGDSHMLCIEFTERENEFFEEKRQRFCEQSPVNKCPCPRIYQPSHDLALTEVN